MIKGAQKRIVVLNTKDSSYFESAYFVMKNDAVGVVKGDSTEERSMLKEADRIVSEAVGENKRKKKRPMGGVIRSVLLFIIGGTSGAFVTWLIFMLDK